MPQTADQLGGCCEGILNKQSYLLLHYFLLAHEYNYFCMHELGWDASEARLEVASRYAAWFPSISRAGDLYRAISEASKRYFPDFCYFYPNVFN